MDASLVARRADNRYFSVARPQAEEVYSRAMHNDTQDKPWGGRFTEATDAFVEAFTASVHFDKRLYKHDIAGSIAHARMLAKVGVLSEADRDSHHQGPAGHPRRHRARRLRLGYCARRRAHEHRGASHRTYRRGRQASAYGPLAQRPGGDRHPSVSARCHRRPARRTQTPATGPDRSRRTRGRYPDARLHALADRATGDLRSPHAGLVRDAGTRPRPARRLPQAGQHLAARCRRAGRYQLSHRPPLHRRTAGLRCTRGKFPGCGQRPRLRGGILRRLRIDHDAPVALFRGTGAVVLGAVRLHRSAGPLLHRLIDHAAEEESRRPGAGARQNRPRVSAT